MLISFRKDLTLTFFSLTDKIGVFSTVCPRHRNPNDWKAEFDLGEDDNAYNDMVWAFICEWLLNLLNIELSIRYYSLFMEQLLVSFNTQFVSMCDLVKIVID